MAEFTKNYEQETNCGEISIVISKNNEYNIQAEMKKMYVIKNLCIS